MAPATAELEISFYVGNYFSGILQGVEIVMYFMTMYFLMKNGDSSKRGNRFFMIYSTVLLVLLTIDNALNSLLGQLMWINFREMEGGPIAYFAIGISSSYQALATTAIVLVNFLGDALLIWRLFVIWGSNFLVIAFPIVLFLAAFSMSILYLVASFTPGGNVFHGLSVSYGMPYYTLTIGLNVVVTGLILYRVLGAARQLERTMGKEHAKAYTSIAAIVVESALPFTLLGIATIIPYALEHPTAIAIGQVWAKFMCLSPQFIVLRVSMGKAWTKATVHQYESSLGQATFTGTATNTKVANDTKSLESTGKYSGTNV